MNKASALALVVILLGAVLAIEVLRGPSPGAPATADRAPGDDRGGGAGEVGAPIAPVGAGGARAPAEPEPEREEALEPDAAPPIDVAGCVRAYFAWLDGLTAAEREAFWSESADGLDALPAELARTLCADLAEPGEGRQAFEALYHGWMGHARRHGGDVLSVTAAELDRQDRLDLVRWRHALSLLLAHLSAPEGSYEPARVWSILSQYVLTWVGPDAGQVGDPSKVLIALFAAAARDEAVLLQTLELVEAGLRRGALDGDSVMVTLSFLPAALRDRPDPRGALDRLVAWFTSAGRHPDVVWGYVELLRQAVVGGIYSAEDVASLAVTPDRLFEQEARTTRFALFELLSSFGEEAGGARLLALFREWAVRYTDGEAFPTELDLEMLIGFAAEARGGVRFEDLAPLLGRAELWKLTLGALDALAAEDGARVAAAWRSLLADPALDDEGRRAVFAALARHGFASRSELMAALDDPLLDEQAFWALREQDYLGDRFLSFAARTDDPEASVAAYHSVLENEAKRGLEVSRMMLRSPLADVHARGLAQLAAIAALAESRGQTALREEFFDAARAAPDAVWESSVWGGIPAERLKQDAGALFYGLYAADPEQLAQQAWVSAPLEEE